MKTATILSALLAATMAVMLSSCNKQIEEKTSSIVLSSGTATVPAAGGEFTLPLSVVNPVEGGILTAESAQEWITVTCESLDSICFYVSANGETAPREGSVSINYTGIQEPAVLSITQEAGNGSGHEQSIDIQVKDISQTSFTANIVPSDNDMLYIITIVTMDFITERGYGDDDQALFEYEMSYYSMISQATGTPMAELIERDAHKGPEMDYPLTGLFPETEYLLYAYGVDTENLELMTDIARCPVTTDNPEIQDIKFGISTEVSGVVVDMTVSPIDFDGYYYMDILTGISSDDDVESECSALWNTLRNLYITDGYDIDRILKEICYSGESSKRFELMPNSDYYALAFAVDEEALMSSAPTYAKIRTTDVLPSDNEITIHIDNITSRSALVSSTTTNDDTYAFLVMQASKLAGLNDSQILEYLTTNYNLFKVNGDYAENVTGLEPDTEYIAAAFGFVSQTVTTQLYKKTFRTLSE